MNEARGQCKRLLSAVSSVSVCIIIHSVIAIVPYTDLCMTWQQVGTYNAVIEIDLGFITCSQRKPK